MPDHDPPASAWRQVLGPADLDAAELAHALHSSTEPRHGLTLVLGFPFPARTLHWIREVRTALEGIAPGQIRWMEPAACHLTVYGLKRSQALPLDQGQVDALWTRLRPALREALAGAAGIRVRLGGTAIGPQGTLFLEAGECPLLDALRDVLRQLPGVDPPKAGENHVTLGQLARPFGSASALHRAADAVWELGRRAAHELAADRVRLVCYRTRWLEEVAWQEAVIVGEPARRATPGIGARGEAR